MPYDNVLLADADHHTLFAPKLPGRLISWITRLAAPRRPAGCADSPPSAHALLQQLLDHHPQARTVFAHLAAVEICLHMNDVEPLKDLPASVLERAHAELLSIAGEVNVEPLLELLGAPHPSTSTDAAAAAAPEPAPSVQARPINAIAPPQIENLEVDEVDEEAYLTALLEWEESAHAA